jgi:hypothetical protein
MMRQKKSEQQHYHSRDGYDHISSSSSSSSSYIQLRNNNNMLTISKSNQSLIHFIHIRSYLTIFLFIFLLLLISFFILFPTQKNPNTYLNHRLKRQILSSNTHINYKQHYTTLLRRMLLHRSSSSVLADCTINMAFDGIYLLPLDTSLSSEVIRLVENTYQKEFNALKSTADKIRKKLNQSPNSLGDFALSKFHDEFSIPIRLLLASQLSIKEINLMIVPSALNDNNGDSYIYYNLIKYYRLINDTIIINQIDYDSIHDVLLKQNVNIILQTFTASNARETLKQTINNNHLLFNDGWWIGPVLCDKNKNETFIMAHIFPLTNR